MHSFLSLTQKHLATMRSALQQQREEPQLDHNVQGNTSACVQEPTVEKCEVSKNVK